MNHHYPVLIVTLPLLFAFVVSGTAWIKKSLCFPLTVVGVGLSAWFSICLLGQVAATGPVEYRLGGWAMPWGIGYRVDTLSGLVVAVVTVLAFINLMATWKTVAQETPDKTGAFYSLYLLFMVGLTGILVTGDLFNLYVLLEVASLTSYALIGMGNGRAPMSALNYLFVGTLGGCFYLLGVGYLYIMTGSLNMADVATLLPPLFNSSAIVMAFIFCMAGVSIKMAFFPLHMWLPNAYGNAPTAAGSLIAPLMTKVMVYVLIRLILTVFSVDFAFAVLKMGSPMVWMSSLAIVAGAVFALAQKNLKRMFCHIIVSEIGYMMGGAWLGNNAGMTGAVLHIFNDAVMTLCLFLCAASIYYRTHGLEMDRLKGLFRKMPVTMACFVAGALSIIGVPPTCGFFSKWYLISGGLQAGQYAFVAALVFSSLINAVLFFRVIEVSYYGDFETHNAHGSSGAAIMESPASMLVPLIIVSTGLMVVGLYTGGIVNHLIHPIVLKAGFSG